MPIARYLSHPQVRIDPAVPVPRWSLSERGRARAQIAGRRTVDRLVAPYRIE